MSTMQTLASFRKGRNIEASPDKLIRDARMVLQDAEDLIKATAGDIGDRTREARAKLAGALVVTRETCNRLECHLTQRAQATDAALREHPYEALAMALGVGAAVGVLAHRLLDRND